MKERGGGEREREEEKGRGVGRSEQEEEEFQRGDKGPEYESGRRKENQKVCAVRDEARTVKGEG